MFLLRRRSIQEKSCCSFPCMLLHVKLLIRNVRPAGTLKFAAEHLLSKEHRLHCSVKSITLRRHCKCIILPGGFTSWLSKPLSRTTDSACSLRAFVNWLKPVHMLTQAKRRRCTSQVIPHCIRDCNQMHEANKDFQHRIFFSMNVVVQKREMTRQRFAFGKV